MRLFVEFAGSAAACSSSRSAGRAARWICRRAELVWSAVAALEGAGVVGLVARRRLAAWLGTPPRCTLGIARRMRSGPPHKPLRMLAGNWLCNAKV